MPRRFWLLILAPCLLATMPALGDESFSAVAEKYDALIRKDLQPDERMSLVAEVAAFDHREAAKLLLESLGDLSKRLDGFLTELDEIESQREVLNSESSDKKQIRETERLRAKRDRFDELIVAESEVVDRIGDGLLAFTTEPARGFVVTMVGRGTTWRQRGFAARAAAGYPTEAGRKAALKGLKDKEARVVLLALAGLATRKDAATVPGVAKCLEHEAWVVTVTAAGTLAEIGSTTAVRPLIETLGRTTGRVQDDVNTALKKLTGQKFQPDYDSWKRWYEENKAELEGEKARPLGRAGKKGEADDSSYYGIQTRSQHIVYVLDISGSMNLEIGGKEIVTPEPGQEEKPSGPKVEIAKRELKTAIRSLPESAWFNVITFNEVVAVWKKKMIQANQENKNEAYLYINDLKASGSTYTYGALKEAFRFAGLGATDPSYDSGVDTIFLLSDGMPTDQSFPTSKAMEPEKILRAVRTWNKLSKVVIHAIAIDPKTQGSSFIRFMRDLAKQNGGQYTERG